MNIGIVIYTDIPNGGATAHRVLMMGKGLASWGNTVHILAPYKFSPGPLVDEIDGVIIHWGAYQDQQASFGFLATLRKRLLLFNITRQVLKKGLDWLIVYDMGIDGLPFLLLAKHYNCCVATDTCDIRYLSDNASYTKYIYKISCNIGHWCVTPHTNLNIVISHYLDDYLKKKAAHVPRLLIPAPVDVDKFHFDPDAAEAFRRKHGLQDKLILGYFGSIWAVKGLENFLTAIKKLDRNKYNFKLLITGNAGKNAYFLKLIEEYNLKDLVVLTGYLSQDELIKAMSAADVVIEPKTGHEANIASFPQKIAEYLAMGKPMVASAIGDLPYYLQDRTNALLCKAGDPDALAQALQKLMADEGLREKLSIKARETAMQYFDCRKLAEHIHAKFVHIRNSSPNNK